MKNVESAGIIAAVTIISLIVIGWQIYDYSQNLGQIKYAIYDDLKDDVVFQTSRHINDTIYSINRGEMDSAVYLLDKAICLMDSNQYRTSITLGEDYGVLYAYLSTHSEIYDKIVQVRWNLFRGNLTQVDVDYLQRCANFYKFIHDRMVEPTGGQYRILDLYDILVQLGRL